jgi:hypothetical protein
MQQADAAGKIDWEVHFADGTMVRAHQYAAGAKGGGNPQAQALGRSVGGFSTKMHIKAEGLVKPKLESRFDGRSRAARTKPLLG